MQDDGSMRLLLIEDNLGDARLIREMLRDQADVAITHVETLEEAVDACRDATCDMALLDLSLPDSSGVETVLRLSADLPHLPIVVLTGSDDEELGIEAVQAGAQDYLVKGDTDAKLLRRALRYARERHQIETVLRRSEQEYRSLIDDVFDTSMVAVLILDHDFTVVWANEATEIYFGVPREELLGEDKRKLIDSKLKCIFADPDDYAARLLKAYDEGSFTDRFECHVMPTANRDDRWLEHWSQPIRDGMYVGGRIEQYTDITDRKKAEMAEQEQRRFADALRESAEALTSTLELDAVLDRILVNIARVVPNDAANVVLIDENDDMHIERSRGGDAIKTQELMLLRQPLAHTPILHTMLQNHQPITISNLTDSDLQDALRPTDRVQSYAGAPIIVQGEGIGFINIFSHEREAFQQDALDRLSAFADQAAVAIQNAQLYQRSKELAAIQERQRLARELHDSVSQTLFSSQTMAEAALRQWRANPQRARSLLDEVYRLLVNALAEMRILLLELRPSTLTQVGLKQLFEQYLQAQVGKQDIAIRLDIDEIPALLPDVQIALYRIVQEAVNNVIKHAEARNVTVSARMLGDLLELVVQDDGKGFASAEARSTSLGLGIMRERAEGIDAALEVNSSQGHGTRVVVTWRKPQQKDE
ncbi:MAG: response regulator [Anaerolineae bacterium]|nr:response regulator [Anaerolineae bacterium]